jgi:hypothetical protein
MTYWAREHEHNLRRIGDIMRELEHAYEDIIPALINDLGEDDLAATEEARDLLRESRAALAITMGSLERVKTALPEPQYRPTVHPTAADVMERDA